MKNILLTTLGGLLVAGVMAFGQAQNPATPQMGRGRGGAPYAWNDKNKDGICDITGKPVGQGRGAAFGRGGCRCGAGRRCGAGGGGMRRGMWCGACPPAGAQTAPSQPQK